MNYYNPPYQCALVSLVLVRACVALGTLDVVYYEVDVGDDLLLSFDSFPD
jgi:hypothetical protein